MIELKAKKILMKATGEKSILNTVAIIKGICNHYKKNLKIRDLTARIIMNKKNHKEKLENMYLMIVTEN